MKLGIILMLMILTGCTTGITDVSCIVFRPITYSLKNDTPETVRQAREHDSVWNSLCKKP